MVQSRECRYREHVCALESLYDTRDRVVQYRSVLFSFLLTSMCDRSPLRWEGVVKGRTSSAFLHSVLRIIRPNVRLEAATRSVGVPTTARCVCTMKAVLFF